MNPVMQFLAHEVETILFRMLPECLKMPSLSISLPKGERQKNRVFLSLFSLCMSSLQDFIYFVIHYHGLKPVATVIVFLRNFITNII